MNAEAQDRFADRLPAHLAEKTEETPEETALREEKERRIMHAGELAAMLAFIAFVIASGAVSLYVAARWAGAVGVEVPGFWDATPVRAAAVAVLAVGGTLVAWGRLVEPGLLRITRVEVETVKLAAGGVPPPRLVFLSDLHAEGRSRRLRRLPGVVKGLAPEAILLGGDYLNDDRERTVEALASVVRELAEIAPVYAVIGNADEPRPVAYQTVAAAGAKVLVNESVELAASSAPPGGPDPRAGGVTLWGLRWLDEDALAEAEAKLDRTRVNVCLTHAPGMIPGAERAGFDLYLTGHTHGGQVRLPGYGALITLGVHGKRFESGRYRLPEGMTAYVTRGVGPEGGWTTRVRFMCPPEVVLVEFVGGA
jgi:predicted MPP superfamily phosphohydrolase